MRPPLLIRLTPYFLPALLFSSVFFAAFSPVPLFFFRERAKAGLVGLAILTNAFLVALLTHGLGGTDIQALVLNAIVFLALIVPVAILLPLFAVKAHWKLTPSVLATVASILVGLVLVTVFSKTYLHLDLLGNLRELVSAQVAEYAKQAPEKAIQIFGGDSPEEFEKRVWKELPLNGLLVVLLVVWTNTLLWLRFNPGNIREKLGLNPRLFLEWKAPEWLIWPTIAVSAIAIFANGQPIETQAWGVLRIFGAVYVFQGVSILYFFLDHWKVRGGFRPLLVLLSLLFAMPLLLVLGVVDLWFDFRTKKGQS